MKNKEETKPEKQKRDKRLSETRVTLTELETIKEKAVAAGLSVSEYQRQALLNGVVIVRESLADAKLLRLLSAIGNNLNQLVRKSHIHDETDTEKMHDILEGLDTIIMGIVSDS